MMAINNSTTVEAGRCQQHCGHDPSFIKDGVCGHYPTRDGYAGNICGHRCQLSPRVCQRGVDGSPGCGHSLGYAQSTRGIPAVTPFCICNHRCDLSPSPLEAGVEVHEFVEYGSDVDLCGAAIYENDVCGQPSDAEVHKVASEPPWTDGQKQALADVYNAANKEAVLVEEQVELGLALKGTLPARSVELPARVNTGTPPDRIWVRTPSYMEYQLIDPIRKALAACEVDNCSSGGTVLVDRADWKNLVRTIEGDKDAINKT